MIRRRPHLGRPLAGVLAVLAACALSPPAFAEKLVFRNDSDGPVVVHAVSVCRGVLRRDRPHLLRPGDATPAVEMPGDKVITVYDPGVPNRVLFQGPLPAGRADLFFRILPDSPAPRVRLEQAPPPGP